jgi:hypothetical protein
VSDETAAGEFVKQIDTYSNAMVVFAVFQSLSYSYSFGSNEFFNCLVRNADYLAYILIVIFVVTTGFMLFAVHRLGRAVAGVSEGIAPEHAKIVKNIYRGKLAIVLLSSLAPISVTYLYATPHFAMKQDCHRHFLGG